MDSTRKYTKIIDRYLDGEMDGEELTSFENELDLNPELRKELKLHREIKIALGEKEIIDLRGQLKGIHRSIFEPKKEMSFSKRMVTSSITHVAAASIVILLSIAIFSNLFTGNISVNDRLFDKYYERYEPLNVRSGSYEINEMYRKALVAYHNENFENALILFEDVLNYDQTRMEANIMSGVSNMELSEYKKASSSFRKVLDHKNNLFIEDAQWYLGFCYLKTENTNKAIDQFTKIATSTSSRKEKARKILRKIN